MIDTDRLDKLLGMLTSGFGGEQANAATMISKIAAQHKMTVPELMQAAVLQKNGGAKSSQQSSQHKSKSYSYQDYDRTDFADVGNPILSKLRIIVSDCPQILSEWELKFAGDVAARYSADNYLSEKQLAVINKILFKFEQAAAKKSA